MAPSDRPRILRLAELDDDQRRALTERGAIDLAGVVERARPIVEAVRREGDAALLRFAREFDRADLASTGLKVPRDAFDKAYDRVPQDVIDAIRLAAANIRTIHEKQKPEEYELTTVRPGVIAGDRYVPIEAVACYVPRGKGSFPSVTLMTAIPAVVAGCPRVVVLTPPGPDGACDPGTLVAAREAGVDEVYLAGGAQAIAAVAFGTETVPRCHKVVGPGSPWVVAGMRLCADFIAPGPPAGPSESMVLADEGADIERLALDLMIEAEHGPDSTTFLVTLSESAAAAVAGRIVELAERLGEQRRDYVTTVFSRNGGLLVARDLDDAIAFANEFAAEHLQIACANPWDVAARIVNAGEILLGQDAPFSMANFMIGVNAVLPTGGKARSASALGVMDYIKRMSVAHLTREGYEGLAAATEAFARYEGFDAHGLAITARPGPSKPT